MPSNPFYDLIVVGAGMGGLATAALAANFGLKTALLEAHTKVGGCAGYFSRQEWTFDVGATALMGLNRGEPIGDLLGTLQIPFQAQKTSTYRVVLPDRTFDIDADPTRFENRAIAAFPDLNPKALLDFWKLQYKVGGSLFQAAAKIPRFPIHKFSDLTHNLAILGFSGSAYSALAATTVLNVLKFFGLDQDRSFYALISMLLQDTAQAGAETVPFATAAACLQAYRMGMSRPIGGMKALVEGIARRFVELGGDLRAATLVDRVRSNDDGTFSVTTRRRGEPLRTRRVAFNLPLDLASRLLDRPLEGRLETLEKRSRAVWSAFTAYLAIDRGAVPDDSPLFHQVLRDYDQPIHDGNNVLISLSPIGDSGYAPPHARAATLSTHVDPAEWIGLGEDDRESKKREYGDRMIRALGRALPNAPAALIYGEFATPRAFERYTRRTDGRVGGAPAGLWNGHVFAVGSDVLGKGLWVVGDSVFPGQGTLATVVSAIRAVERITGISWK